MSKPESETSNVESRGFFLSRQPIVAGERRLIGWEMAFGAPDGRTLSVGQENSEEYLAAAMEFSKTANWDSLLCGGRALLPVDRRLVFSDVIEDLPRNRFLLGLAPCEEVDANLSNRLHDLHSRRGTRLLFFGYRRRDPREQLLDLVDAVEIDAFKLDEDARSLLVRRAQRRNLQVLATSVDGDADFVRIRDSGFELFSGKSYSEHSEDADTQATADGKELLQLLVEARGELEIEPVTRRIEATPALEEGLLRLVNSLELARAQKIENVGQALIMIGAKGLSRWLNLLLFQIGSKHGTRGPLFRVAASRARLMELMVGSGTDEATREIKSRGDIAFLVGIMSLVHVLLGVDRKKAISGLVLPEEMGHALLGYEGELGRMLRLCECLDSGEFVEAAEISQELGISPRALWAYQCAAFDWVAQMI
ncbi:MAG: EAL and HDOD domain-containing protein [Myxococcota bacterium]